MGGAQFPAGFTSQGATSPIATIRIVRMSVAAAILDGGSDNTLMSRLGGDYTRDNFHILHQTRRGADRGVVISDRKNLTGYKSVLDFSTVTTRILPVGFDGLLLPELYVDSPKLGQYQQPHVRVQRFEKVKAAPEGETQETMSSRSRGLMLSCGAWRNDSSAKTTWTNRPPRIRCLSLTSPPRPSTRTCKT